MSTPVASPKVKPEPLEAITPSALEALLALAKYIREKQTSPSLLLWGRYMNKSKTAAQNAVDYLKPRRLVEPIENVRYGKYVPSETGWRHIRRAQRAKTKQAA